MNPALLMMIGSMVQGAGSGMGSLLSVKSAKYGMHVANAYADYIEAITNFKAAQIDRIRDATISSQRAQTAASGIDPNDETSQLIRAETEILADIDKNILRSNGNLEALRFRSEGYTSMAAGYGQAAQLGAQGFGSLLSTAMSWGERQGWFTPNRSSGYDAADYSPAPEYPRSYRTF